MMDKEQPGQTPDTACSLRLSPSSSTGKWIGYQIIVALGRGLGLQVPIVAVQITLPPFDRLVLDVLVDIPSYAWGSADADVWRDDFH
jgi:hypothetical protein